MSIASPTNTDYGTVIEALRASLNFGTPLGEYNTRLALAVVKDGISRDSAVNTVIAAANTALLAYESSATCAAGSGVACAAAVVAQRAALAAAIVTAPTFVSSSLKDG